VPVKSRPADPFAQALARTNLRADSFARQNDAQGAQATAADGALLEDHSRYSAILDLTPTDPTQLDDLYEFVPPLRRSLRLSQAARCAPVFGSDYLIDDENGGPPGLPQLFQIRYLGEKEILALEHAVPASFDLSVTPTQLDSRYYYAGGTGVVPLPKPTMGRWELRDSYVLSLKPLPQFAKGYCYDERIMYVDKENYFGSDTSTSAVTPIPRV